VGSDCCWGCGHHYHGAAPGHAVRCAAGLTDIRGVTFDPNGKLVVVYDAVAVSTIPQEASIILAYVDGWNPTYDTCRELFPNATLITVTTGSKPGARICDCETGDDTPYQAALWANNEVRAGRRPTIYVEIANRPLIVDYLADFGLETGRDVDIFSAWWNNDRQLIQTMPGSNVPLVGEVGHQFVMVSQNTYDVSVALAAWVPVVPPPPPPPQAIGELMIFQWLKNLYVVSGYPARATLLVDNAAVAIRAAATAGNVKIIEDVQAGLFNQFYVGDTKPNANK